MASLNDIARDAGVSVRTVSRALKNSGYVAPATLKRIKRVATRLDYRPNVIARSLRTGKSMEIAVLIRSVDELHVAKLESMEDVFRKRGYRVHVMFSPEETGAADGLVEELLHTRPAGLAVFPGVEVSARRLVDLRKKSGMAVVLVDRVMKGVDSVGIDRPQGVYEAVKFLASRGRRRIAYLGPESDRTRLDGYEAARKELGLPRILISMMRARSFEDGLRSAREFASMNPRPDAVQAFSDVVALGFLAGLHERSITVPGDVALVGFDDRRAASLCWPQLTTVAQPNREVGAMAAEIIMSGIDAGEKRRRRVTTLLPTRLIMRETA